MNIHNLFLTGLFFCLSLVLSAQITIDHTDMPAVDDTFRVSSSDTLLGNMPAMTGANYTWDYSFLNADDQEKVEYSSVNSTPIVYSVFFGIPPGNPKANLATPFGGNFISFGPISAQDVYAFIKNDSSSFRGIGFGATVNNIQVPFEYSTKDTIYNFPLNYGNEDSSWSFIKGNIPGIAYFERTQIRVSEVDGWGMLYLPEDTFEVLHIRMIVTTSDSGYISNLGFGIRINQPPTTEYHWLAKGSGIPVLKITDQMGGPVGSSIEYQDIYRYIEPSGVIDAPVFSDIRLFPNPSSGALNLQIDNKDQNSIDIRIIDLMGKTHYEWKDIDLQSGRNNLNLSEGTEMLSSGIYFISIHSGDNVYTSRWIKK